MARIDKDTLAVLRSRQQRFKARVAVFGTFKMLVTTTLADAGGEVDPDTGEPVPVADTAQDQSRLIRFAEEDWKPVLNIGPHRYVEVGETVTFDADDSYERGVGWGVVKWTGGEWDFGDAATPATASGEGPHEVSFNAPGLYEITYSHSGQTARRWVRVRAADAVDAWQVTQVGGVQGSWGGGWTMSLTLQGVGEESAFDPGSLNDYRCIGLYVEDEWLIDGAYVNENIGASRHDSRLVMIGYIKQGATSIDWQTRSVTLTVETVESMMGRGQMHQVITICNQKHVERRGSTRDPNTGEDQPAADGEGDDKDLQYGISFEGIPTVLTSDTVLFVLQQRTNLLEWHDFLGTWNGTMGDLESVTLSEGAVGAGVQSAGGNDWNLFGTRFDNAILFAPDRQVSYQDVYWNKRWDGGKRVVTLTAQDLLKADFAENTQKIVKWVQLIATDTFQVADSTKARKIGRYPGTQPPTDEFGNWVTRNDLLHDDQSVIEMRAKDVYEFSNLRWTGSVVLGLNRAITPGDWIWINLKNAQWSSVDSNSQVDWYTKKFIVMAVSYGIDVANTAWQTQIQVQQAPLRPGEWDEEDPDDNPDPDQGDEDGDHGPTCPIRSVTYFTSTLSDPVALRFDADKSMFIADGGDENGGVENWDGSGESWTFTRNIGGDGDRTGGVDISGKSDNKIWITKPDRNKAKTYYNTDGALRFTVEQGFQNPGAIAVDPSSMDAFISDRAGSTIYRVNYNGDETRKKFGGGELDQINGMDFGPDGNLWVCDSGSGKIHVFTRNGTPVKTMGVASPQDLHWASNDTLYVIDGETIRVFDIDGNELQSWTGTTPASIGTVETDRLSGQNRAIGSTGDGYIYVADSSYASVRIFLQECGYTPPPPDPIVPKLTVKREIGVEVTPFGLDIATDGTLYIAHQIAFTVRKYNSQQLTGNPSLGILTSIPLQLYYEPIGVAVGPDGNIYCSYRYYIRKVAPNGTTLMEWNANGSPRRLTRGPDGNIWVAYDNTTGIRAYSTSGTLVKTIGGPGTGAGALTSGFDIAFDSQGNAYVVDTTPCRIVKYDAQGNYVSHWGAAGSNDSQFTRPVAITIDPATDIVYVADYISANMSGTTHAIKAFTLDGQFLKKSSLGGMSKPTDMVIYNGELFATDGSYTDGGGAQYSRNYVTVYDISEEVTP